MKIVPCILNYQGKATTYDFIPRDFDSEDEWIVIDEKGIGNACNTALDLAFNTLEADYCLILANDIREPENAIELRLNAIKDTDGKVGICSIPCDKHQPRETVLAAGNFMISRKLFEKIGYFTTRWDADGYGPIDLEYCVRSYLAGFKNINVQGFLAEHLDNGDKAYGYSKREVLQKTYPEFTRWKNDIMGRLNPTLYLPYEQS